VLTIVVSSDCMKKPAATIQSNAVWLESLLI
jgi:hypothetical protein